MKFGKCIWIGVCVYMRVLKTCVSAYVCVCVCACVHACLRPCINVCVCVSACSSTPPHSPPHSPPPSACCSPGVRRRWPMGWRCGGRPCWRWGAPPNSLCASSSSRSPSPGRGPSWKWWARRTLRHTLRHTHRHTRQNTWANAMRTDDDQFNAPSYSRIFLQYLPK